MLKISRSELAVVNRENTKTERFMPSNKYNSNKLASKCNINK